MQIDWNERQWLAMPEEMTILQRFATQPGNQRSRKPARFIWFYTLGNNRAEILADLRVSESTLERWFEKWIDYGVSGLTGSIHSKLGRLY